MQEHKRELLKKLSSSPSANINSGEWGKSNNLKWVIYVFCALMCIGLFFWWKSNNSSKGKDVLDNKESIALTQPSSNAYPSPPKQTFNAYALNASGYVVARRKATVSSEETGKIATILVEEGQHVVKGDILARLDDREAAANFQYQNGSVNAISADVLEIESKLKSAQKALSRSSNLFEKNLISSLDHDNDIANAEQLSYALESKKASLDQGKGALALAKKRLEDTAIKAPFEGVITMKNAQPGEIVSPVSTGGGFTRTGICTLVDMSSLEIEVDVNENYISKVYIEQKVDTTLNAFPDKKYSGKVVAIIPQGNRQSSTIKVRVKLQDIDSHVFPDMGVSVSFHEKKSNIEYGGL